MGLCRVCNIVLVFCFRAFGSLYIQLFMEIKWYHCWHEWVMVKLCDSEPDFFLKNIMVKGWGQGHTRELDRVGFSECQLILLVQISFMKVESIFSLRRR